MLKKKYHGLGLFSGGLDSILALKLIQRQGLNILGIHFYSPFFGAPEKIDYWEKLYGLELLGVDISKEYLSMLLGNVKHGLGKVLNPCVDCKILILKKVKKMLSMYGASFIVSGEVLGQRPMSQRRDTLFLILKEAGVSDILLRPLTALNLPSTRVENLGLVDRQKLLGIKGRGRKAQLELARQLGLEEIPSPAGGCLLTDPEMGKRYLMLISKISSPLSIDFLLCKIGRQFWWGNKWLIIGRNKEDNESLIKLSSSEDIILKIKDFPGPLGLARKGTNWSKEDLTLAASFLLLFAPKVRQSGHTEFGVLFLRERESTEVCVGLKNRKDFFWKEPEWDEKKKKLLLRSV
ncbi:tRNA(5-methylaminomethyl-2-thiouridylate) methyltransferase [Desulfonauticus submarinus]